MDRRRRVPRQIAGWMGKYVVEGDEPEVWNDCKVADVSVIGLGIELLGVVPDADNLRGRNIIVESTTPAGASLSVRAKGEVKNIGPETKRGICVGIEFVEMTDLERSILDALVAMDALW